MADDIDLANDQAQALHESALLRRKPEAPAPNGYCLNCDDRFPEVAPFTRRWCDANCRNQWEKENK